MKTFARTLLALAALALAPAAFALTATINLGWTPPTTDVNGNPLAGTSNVVTGYKIWRSLAPITGNPTTATIATPGAGATSYTDTFTVSNGDTLYYYIEACNATGCSDAAAAPPYTVNIPAAKPSVPTSVTVTVTFN